MSFNKELNKIFVWARQGKWDKEKDDYFRPHILAYGYIGLLWYFRTSRHVSKIGDREFYSLKMMSSILGVKNFGMIPFWRRMLPYLNITKMKGKHKYLLTEYQVELIKEWYTKYKEKKCTMQEAQKNIIYRWDLEDVV